MYEGWFYFVGKVIEDHYGQPSPDGAFDFFVSQDGPMPQPELQDHDVVMLEFRVSAPWRLDKPWSDGLNSINPPDVPFYDPNK